MAKLWDKGYELDRLIERFTVGDDYELDQRLIAADAVASMAHVRMLASIGVLTDSEAASLHGELVAIARAGEAGRFTVARSDEDGHTAIENRLTEKLGDTGKKVHTGRSRNDQVMAATRLYMREGILAIRESLHRAADAFLRFAERERDTFMPGRTHMQPAMPSTVGLWAASYADLLLDDDLLLATAYELVNRSPLGAGAGYGVPLPLDREMVSRLLGFRGVQHNVIAVNTSRGKVEAALLDAVDQVGLTLGRLATDLILFSMPEFAYFSLPPALCSGSSIMPHKRNPDGLELLRSKSGTLSSLAAAVRNTIRSLPSGYNRDVQDTKGPVMRGIDTVLDMLAVSILTIESVEVDRDRLNTSLTPDLVATDEVFRRVQDGASFRDAYRDVAAGLADLDVGSFDPATITARRTSTGTPGNPGLEAQKERLGSHESWRERDAAAVSEAVTALAGSSVSLFRPTVS